MRFSMQNKEFDIFKEPAVKIFCRQLKDCRSSSGQSERERFLVTLRSSVTGKELLYPICSVWLQGTIQTLIGETHVILKDVSGGLVKITNCDKMVGGSKWIEQGLYCSVVGCLQSCTQTPVVQAVKMNKLKRNCYLEELWEWEVMDLANELCDNQ